MRIIDADKLKEKVERRILNNPIYGKHFKEFIKVFMGTVVDNEPTVDPVKHGHWINTYGDTPHDPRDKTTGGIAPNVDIPFQQVLNLIIAPNVVRKWTVKSNV